MSILSLNSEGELIIAYPDGKPVFKTGQQSVFLLKVLDRLESCTCYGEPGSKDYEEHLRIIEILKNLLEEN